MFIRLLASLWEVNDSLPPQADYVVPVAHGATETGPTKGAITVCSVTRSLLKLYPEAQCRFGTYTGSLNPEVERDYKEALPRSSYLGRVMTTIQECMAFQKSLNGSEAMTIVVVSDQAHSRRCKIVWKTFFPKSDIRVCAVSIWSTIDQNSPMTPYHKAWTALLFQAAPTPFFWYLSLRGQEYMASWATKIHQPVAK